MTDFRKPNLFLVGAAKSGTTAMSDYLDQHPDIHMGPKEMHYFTPDLLPETSPALVWENYITPYKNIGDEKIIGDASVFYLYSNVAAGLIHEFNPDARILIHLRNPLDVMESHHSQVMFEGGEPIKDFEEAVRAEPERLQGRNLPENFAWKKTLCYRDFVSFSEQVKRFQDVFPREQIRVNIFDDFKKDTMGEYRRTLEFLGTDADFEPNIEVVNANKVMRSETAMKLFVRNPPPWLSIPAKALFPLSLRNKIKSKIKRANTKFTPRPPVRPELRQELARDLMPDVERLSELLDRDLTHWCRVG